MSDPIAAIGSKKNSTLALAGIRSALRLPSAAASCPHAIAVLHPAAPV